MTVRTGTQTLEIQASPEYRVLRLKLTPKQRLQAVITKMQEAAKTLPQEHQARVLQALFDWETKFFQKYRMDSPVDVEREEAAHALLFLKFSHIERHITLCATTTLERVKWVVFSNDIVAIVADLLPPEIDLNAFILTDQNKQLELMARLKAAQTVREVMPAISADFARAEERVYGMANQAGADLHGSSRETQGHLARLSDERAVTITQLHEQYDDLTRDVSQMARQLEGQLHNAQDLGSKIKSEEGILSQALNECEAVLNKV